MPSPTRITLLDDNTANRIAAGEVVERPASAVKELVENAIDAGATRVRVALEEGGKRRIEVADDGVGMNAEDAVLALQRHATSKIRSADDLFDVRTLGFRGEALPSIASVSHLTLTSRAAGEDAGVRVEVHGGDIAAVEPVGCPPGTVVVVEDLFFNTPARLKFLKATPTELARAVDAVGHLAVSHPHIAFRVTHGSQELLATPGGGDALAALAALWGREIARRLVPVRFETPGLSVVGHICSPDLTKPGRSHELFFVNRRPIRNRLLGHALEHGLRALTPESRYPIAALAVDITPGLVDVNVHPTKAEVKFTRDGDIHHAVSEAIRAALIDHGMVPTLAMSGSPPEPTRAPLPHPALPGANWDIERLGAAAIDAFRPVGVTPVPLAADVDPLPAADTPAGVEALSEQLRGFRVLGQARNTYIIAATDNGIAIVDQHVAHERVLYERLTTWRQEDGTPAQQLTEPFSLSLGAAEAALLRQRLGDFALAGWGIEPFGRDTFLVRSVPGYVARRRFGDTLRDMVDELVHQTVARRLVVQREHVTITNACKMAVKAGDPLTKEEMAALLEQLAQAKNPFMCPHGRPAVVVVPYGEIDRRFKR